MQEREDADATLADGHGAALSPSPSGGDSSAAAVRGVGKLAYERVCGRTTASLVYATYPLKFLHPRCMARPEADTAVTYALGYGGGLVGGDEVEITCTLHPDTTAVLCTQATTKVFKARASGAPAKQIYSFEVARNATLAFLPDPVTCFERAKYQQQQVFRLASDASLVFIDWMTSGRKRSFLASQSHTETRQETHEQWDFTEYDNMAQVFVDEQLILSDRVRLVDEEGWSLRERMRGMHVLGILVLLGDRFRTIIVRLLEQTRRKRLHHAGDITPQGRLSSQSGWEGVIASGSPLGTHGVLIRFCAVDMESAMRYVRDVLSPLDELLGFMPFRENR